MPSYSRQIKIPGKSAQELYLKVESQIDLFVEKIPLGKMDVERDAGMKSVSLKSSMVTATLICQDGAMVVEAKLSLLAAPFKSKIDEQIDRWVSKNFPT